MQIASMDFLYRKVDQIDDNIVPPQISSHPQTALIRLI